MLSSSYKVLYNMKHLYLIKINIIEINAKGLQTRNMDLLCYIPQETENHNVKDHRLMHYLPALFSIQV